MEEKIKAFMEKHRFKSLPVPYGNEWLGDLTDEMRYKRGNFRYLSAVGKEADKQAIKLVYEALPIFGEVLDKWNENILMTVVWHEDYKPKEEHQWEGNLNDIFNRLDQLNNTYRYCNGMYYKIKEDHAKNFLDIGNSLSPFSSLLIIIIWEATWIKYL